MDGLAAEFQTESETYAKLLEAGLALRDKGPRPAIKLLAEANALVDTWIAHFDLGRAYLDASQFVQADSEFDRCLKRRGELLSDDESYGRLPLVYYHQGRARDMLKAGGCADSFRTYLQIRGKSNEDPLLDEVRAHVTLA